MVQNVHFVAHIKLKYTDPAIQKSHNWGEKELFLLYYRLSTLQTSQEDL